MKFRLVELNENHNSKKIMLTKRKNSKENSNVGKDGVFGKLVDMFNVIDRNFSGFRVRSRNITYFSCYST